MTHIRIIMMAVLLYFFGFPAHSSRADLLADSRAAADVMDSYLQGISVVLGNSVIEKTTDSAIDLATAAGLVKDALDSDTAEVLGFIAEGTSFAGIISDFLSLQGDIEAAAHGDFTKVGSLLSASKDIWDLFWIIASKSGLQSSGILPSGGLVTAFGASNYVIGYQFFIVGQILNLELSLATYGAGVINAGLALIGYLESFMLNAAFSDTEKAMLNDYCVAMDPSELMTLARTGAGIAGFVPKTNYKVADVVVQYPSLIPFLGESKKWTVAADAKVDEADGLKILQLAMWTYTQDAAAKPLPQVTVQFLFNGIWTNVLLGETANLWGVTGGAAQINTLYGPKCAPTLEIPLPANSILPDEVRTLWVFPEGDGTTTTITAFRFGTLSVQSTYLSGNTLSQSTPEDRHVVFPITLSANQNISGLSWAMTPFNTTDDPPYSITFGDSQRQFVDFPSSITAEQSVLASLEIDISSETPAGTYTGLLEIDALNASPEIYAVSVLIPASKESPNILGRITRQDNGQGMDGVSVVFSAGAGTATTANGGYYSHAVPYGWSGTVTPSMSGWQFAPASFTFSSPLTTSPEPQNFSASEVPEAHIEAEPDAFAVFEGSSYHQLKVRPSQNPNDTLIVTVQRLNGDSDLNVTSGNSLTFNASNWQTYQWVQVSANEDADKLSGTAIIRCTAPGWAPKDVVASETDNDGGSVRVYIEPLTARNAGAQWRVNTGAWHNSGEVDDSVPILEDLIVQYKDVSGWYAPPVDHVTLNSLQLSATFTGTYTRATTGAGDLHIAITPAGAIAAGAKWRVDSGSWMNSGDYAHGLTAGTHTAEYANISGYIKPASQIININSDNTAENLGIYSPTGSSVYVSPGQSIQTAIDNAPSGQTIILNDGIFNITNRIIIDKGIILRSLNGPNNTSIVLPGARIHCISVGHTNAIADGIMFQGADYYQNGLGGGAYCGPGMMLNCRMQNNVAGYGAGVYCGNNATLYNCWIENNEAYYGGGGLYIAGNSCVYSCVIKNNTVRNDYDGGGFSAEAGVVRDCLITGNGTGVNGDGAGGAVRNAIVDGCVIAGNTANDSGGGLLLQGGAIVNNSIIINNTAENAGGINCDNSDPIRINNSRVSGNRATLSGGIGGGGLWCDSGTILSNCVVGGNTSAANGGGISSYSGFSAYSTVFTGNTAQAKGGAIYSDGGNNTLVNCLFARNTAIGDGGGIWNYSGSSGPIFNNCTIAYNTASGKGGGIYSDGNAQALLVRNCIVISNTASGGNANYFEWDTGDLKFEYSCSSPLPSGSENTNVNPRFVNATTNNYRLQASSPCIDKGTSTGAPATDIAGIPRPLDGDGTNGPACDMGAYEYVPPSGSIIVRIDPVYAADAGAKWSLDGGVWCNSDYQMDYVPVGTRTVTFTNISGWSQPASYAVSVVASNVVATNGVYLPLSGDTDGDELPDEWEIENFSRLTNVNFSSDYDGDLLSDYYEHLAGTDPRDPASCIVFNDGGISTVPGQGVSLRWYSSAGVSYRVCRTTNLVSGFQVIAPVVSGSAPMTFYTDPSLSGRSYFYRIEKNP